MRSFFQALMGRGVTMLPWLTLLLCSLALAGLILAGPAPADWVFDRDAILGGEWWRLITGHWVHSGLAHAAWDIGALLILGWLFERRLQHCFLPVLIAGMAGVDLWLWWAPPGLERYCGLSGILNTLLAVGLVGLWRECREPLVVVTGLLAVAKIGVEIATSQALFTNSAWPSVPQIHLAGFLTGLLIAGLTSRAVLNRNKDLPSAKPIHGPDAIKNLG